jgi:hypothetical protein
MGRLIRAALDPHSPLSPAFARAAEEIAPAHRGEGDATSLAWLLRPREGLLTKDGQVAGYRSLLAIAPRLRRGLFVVVNSQQVDIDALGMALVDELLGAAPSIDPKVHARCLVPALPKTATPARVMFGDKIRLEGWEAPAQVRPGETAKVRLYFRSVARLKSDYRIFVHGDAPDRAAKRLHHDHFPCNDQDSTAAWRPGELIVDEVTISVPKSYPAPSFDVWLGFYRSNTRLSARSASVKIQQNRVLGPSIRIVKD